jgi:hypothetical protein
MNHCTGLYLVIPGMSLKPSTWLLRKEDREEVIIEEG